jgi:hypothetical protein
MMIESIPVLKPRGIGELFDQAIRLYRNNFLKFIGIIAIAQIPIQILNLAINLLTFRRTIANLSAAQLPDDQNPFFWMMNQLGPGLGASLVIGIISFILVQGFAMAALTRAITDSFLGEEIGIEKSYRKISGSWKTLLVALILLLLLDLVLLLWTLVPCVGWFTGIGALFFVNTVIWVLIAPIVVIERRSGRESIRRAWDLARKRFWWLLGYMLLLSVFSYLIIQGPVTLINAIFQSQMSRGLEPSSLYTYQVIIQSLVALVLSLLYQPLQSACAIMAYFDLRVRLEGFDLAMMANQAGETPLPAIEVAGQAPSDSSKTTLVTAPEMGNFAILSLIGVALYLIMVIAVMAIGALVSTF